MYTDDNARPHRSRAVMAYLQHNAVATLPWIWIHWRSESTEAYLGLIWRRIQTMEPAILNIREVEAVVHREWLQLLLQHNRHFTGEWDVGSRPSSGNVEVIFATANFFLRMLSRDNKWTFQAGIVIWNCFMTYTAPYLKWYCFCCKTGNMLTRPCCD